MSRYAVHALLSVTDGASQEVTTEATDLDDALNKIRDCVAAYPSFIAISLLHVEDLPASVEGAERAAATGYQR